jgi:hypothetical protein
VKTTVFAPAGIFGGIVKVLSTTPSSLAVAAANVIFYSLNIPNIWNKILPLLS